MMTIGRVPTPDEAKAAGLKAVPRRKTGKELIAEMQRSRDTVHEKALEAARTRCSHDWPTYTRNDGIEACTGCHVRLRDIGGPWLGNGQAK